MGNNIIMGCVLLIMMRRYLDAESSIYILFLAVYTSAHQLQLQLRRIVYALAPCLNLCRLFERGGEGSCDIIFGEGDI